MSRRASDVYRTGFVLKWQPRTAQRKEPISCICRKEDGHRDLKHDTMNTVEMWRYDGPMYATGHLSAVKRITQIVKLGVMIMLDASCSQTLVIKIKAQ